MATLERRLQILLDEERYSRVAEQAARRGASVATVIRDAIDLAYPSNIDVRVEAVNRLLGFESTDTPDHDDTAWGETRDAMDAELAGRFS